MNDAYDSPWKGALDAYFQDFLALLFPEAHQGIDWEKDYKSLDNELQKLARDNRLGGRSVDKLVEVSLAVLADLRPTWRPNGFGYSQWG